jgi:hypothetical protein
LKPSIVILARKFAFCSMSIQLQDLRAKVSDDATFDSDAVIDGEKAREELRQSFILSLMRIHS